VLNEGKYNPVAGNMSFEVFKFLDPESISITLTASDTNRLGIVQNGRARKMTPRECARLQGFPDTYKLLDNDNAVYKQMGNAVSVPVIEAVITDLIENNDIFIKTNANASKSLTWASRTIPTLDQNLPKSVPSLTHCQTDERTTKA
jgi:DNA (cytosine-5)-methyltransferase 1